MKLGMGDRAPGSRPSHVGKDRTRRSDGKMKDRRAVQRAKQQDRWETEAARQAMSLPVFHANRMRRYQRRQGIDPDLHKGQIAATARARRLRKERDEAYEKAARHFGISGERTESWGDSKPGE